MKTAFCQGIVRFCHLRLKTGLITTQNRTLKNERKLSGYSLTVFYVQTIT